MNDTKVLHDLSHLSPFYQNEFKLRQAQWQEDDRRDAIAQFKFFKGMRRAMEEDAILNVYSLESLGTIDEIIAHYLKVLTDV